MLILLCVFCVDNFYSEAVCLYLHKEKNMDSVDELDLSDDSETVEEGT